MLIVEMNPLERALMKCSSIIRKWVNNSLKSNIQCIEELSSGAVYCQFIDMVFEGAMPLDDVIFATNKISDFRKNFIILRKCIDKLKIPLLVPIEDLVWCDFDANINFAANFYYAFQEFSASNPERVKDYNPLAARKYQNFSMKAPTYVSRGTDVPNLDELDPPVMEEGMLKDGYNQDNTYLQECHTSITVARDGRFYFGNDIDPLETEV
ncbi:microtubule-associated protein RP/EB family member 1-like [Drosophila erecta]|uniref:microtubule-associated protein RP/EB family member 1-like n=1 Tax=Drosophila erecta TaxID=7220 RepID=UPI0001780F8F|nr:microtubule-associated protein RP/EB family member 1-like [Drosophila erecta]